MATDHRWLLAVLLLGLGFRLGWNLSRPPIIDARLPDQQEYLDLARNLLSGNGLRFRDTNLDREMLASRTPGYPAFVAMLGGSVHAVRGAQAVVDTSTALAAYLLARKWLGSRAGVLAAAAVAANPFLVYFSSLLLTETLYISLLTWALVLLVRLPVWPGLLAGGGLLAMGVLVRPSGLGMPIVMGMAAVFLRTPSRPAWLLGSAGVTALLTVAVLVPWAERNREVLGERVWTTTNAGVTRYDGFNPLATGASDQSFLSWPGLAYLNDKQLGEVMRDRELDRLASQWIGQTLREQPSRLVWLTIRKIARTWSPMPLSREFGQRRAYVAAGLLYSTPLYALVVLAIYRRCLEGRILVFVLAPAVYLTIVHALSVGSLRYRMPAEPALAIVAASALADRLTRIRIPPAATEND